MQFITRQSSTLKALLAAAIAAFGFFSAAAQADGLGTAARIADYSQIAVMADGSFVAAYPKPLPTIYDNVIAAQRYHADGTPAGAEITVAPHGLFQTAIGSDSQGGFIVVWQEFTSLYVNGQAKSTLHAQHFGADDLPHGPALSLGNGNTQSVAGDAAGNFVIAWDNQTETITTIFDKVCTIGLVGSVFCALETRNTRLDQQLTFQRFNAASVALGAAVTVASSTSNVYQALRSGAVLNYFKLAVAKDGRFALGWISQTSELIASHKLLLARYNAQGSALDKTPITAVSATRAIRLPASPLLDWLALAADNGGGYALDWVHTLITASGSSTGTSGIETRRYAADGSASPVVALVAQKSGETTYLRNAVASNGVQTLAFVSPTAYALRADAAGVPLTLAMPLSSAGIASNGPIYSLGLDALDRAQISFDGNRALNQGTYVQQYF